LEDYFYIGRQFNIENEEGHDHLCCVEERPHELDRLPHQKLRDEH
jgi:hypothetical protein